MEKKPKFLVVGAGFSGAVLARELAEGIPCEIEIWDQRNHIGGNCHTERDKETNIMVHKYGPHIFNTDNENVWSYINKYGEIKPWINRVKACTSRGVFSMPINLLTINQLFGERMNPREAKEFIENISDKSIKEIKNFEEQALKMVGKDLYETFFKEYTIKQWGCDPKELPASILKRLPIRFNYNDNYYNKKYQGIPVDGYTNIIKNILSHKSISINLNKEFLSTEAISKFDHIFYTGPIDKFFSYCKGQLGYRTVFFEKIDIKMEKDTETDYQGNAIVNYTSKDVAWTRIHEHKHFTPWENHKKTVAFKEFSKETKEGDIPYYPKRLKRDIEILKEYRKKAVKTSCVSFLGRLATYRYMDMETVIGEALDFSEKIIPLIKNKKKLPTFPNKE